MKISTVHNKPVNQLPLMESFLTIQGEGFHAGSAAFFIRLGGCDVGCVWCDVKESWDAASHPNKSVEDLVQLAKEAGVSKVVITGGEPLMYDLTTLTDQLHLEEFKTHIETAGVYPVTGNWDWICFSPKKFKAPLAEYYAVADELKIIVFNKSDFKWAEEHAMKCGEKTMLYLQPEWSKKDEMLPLIVEFVKQNPKWRISLQTHKYMDIP